MQHLKRNALLELNVPRFEHNTHSTGAKNSDDLISVDTIPDGKCRCRRELVNHITAKQLRILTTSQATCEVRSELHPFTRGCVLANEQAMRVATRHGCAV